MNSNITVTEVKSQLESLWFNLIAIRRETNEQNKLGIRNTINFTFQQLDKLQVPFSIQNKIITLAEKEESFSKNIDNILNQHNKLYWYEYKYRGFSPGCQPKGHIQINNDKGKFGIVAYNRPLTTKELYDYELKEYAN